MRRLAAVIGSQRWGTRSGEEASSIYDGYFFHCRMADTNEALGADEKTVSCLVVWVVWVVCGGIWRNLAENLMGRKRQSFSL